MGDMLQTAQAWLQQTLKANCSQTVSINDGATTINVQATLGKKLLRLWDKDGGTTLQWTDLDLIVTAADLVFANVLKLPAKGWTVTITLNGHTKTFTLFRMGDEPPFRFTDGYETMLRLHLKCTGGGP